MFNLLKPTKQWCSIQGLGAKQREKARKNTLILKKPKARQRLENKSILVVDDLWTSGATMKEAERVLLDAGAKEVWFWTLATVMDKSL